MSLFTASATAVRTALASVHGEAATYKDLRGKITHTGRLAASGAEVVDEDGLARTRTDQITVIVPLEYAGNAGDVITFEDGQWQGDWIVHEEVARHADSRVLLCNEAAN